MLGHSKINSQDVQRTHFTGYARRRHGNAPVKMADARSELAMLLLGGFQGVTSKHVCRAEMKGERGKRGVV